MIDHLGGSGCRYPDPAVWRTLPAKILPVCGKAWRCGNQRSEASSRLPCPGCLLLQVCLSACVLRKKSPAEKARDNVKIQKPGAESSPPPAPFGVFVFTGVFALMCSSQKTGRRTRGDAKIQKSGAEVCPSPALSRVFAFTGVPSTCGFPHKKIPRLSRRGIFIRHLR